MNKSLILSAVIWGALLNASCSNNSKEDTKLHAQAKASQAQVSHKEILSAEDQAIRDSYLVLDEKAATLYPKKEALDLYKSFVPQAEKIKNKRERERILLNIYQGAQMDKDAFELIGQIIDEDEDRRLRYLPVYCEYMRMLKHPKKQIQQCHLRLANLVKSELSQTPKDDPNYIYDEFVYALSMHNAGYAGYVEKMKKMLEIMPDGDTKNGLRIHYEGVLEENASSSAQ